jgi:hypothetical protein
MIESYFRNGHTVHTFGESDSVQRKPENLRFVLRKIPIDTVQRQMEDERQLSLRQLSQQTELTMATCQQGNTRRSTGDSSLFVAIF